MSKEIFAVTRAVLAEDLLQAATTEATMLWRDREYLPECISVKPGQTIDESPFINAKIDKKDQAFYAKETPAILELLKELAVTDTAIANVDMQPVMPRSMTINYCFAGTKVIPHRDVGDGRDNVSRIATLCSKGLFRVLDQEAEPFIEPTIVTPGDFHELFNPRVRLKRRLHEASTIGDETRISIGFQVPVIRFSS